MRSEDIFFEDYEMYLNLKGISDEVRLVLLDDLYASEEELSDEYKNKISTFITNIDTWYNKVLDRIIAYADQKYGVKITENNLSLMSIFILFEQDEEELFGLGFSTDFDLEHDCGLKIKGTKYDIIEIGGEEVAFSIY